MDYLNTIEEDRKRFKLLNIIRVSIFLSLLFVSTIILLFWNLNAIILPFTVLILIATFFGFLNFYFLDILKFKIIILFQIISDIIFITIMVYLSGGINSPVYFLYLLPILISANFLKKKNTIITASLSFIFFGVISELMFLGLIPAITDNYQSTISIRSFVYNLLMSYIAFLSISIAASIYFTNMKKKGAELQLVKNSLEHLAKLNSTVIDKMEHGFITANIDGTIISSNKIAQKILDIHRNKNIFNILELSPQDYKLKELSDKNKQIFIEKEIDKRTLNFSISLISNISSFNKIIVLLFSDLTKKIEIEKKLKEKEHLALIGEMAAGIAHEIRNPLASISGSVQFLKNEISLKEDQKNLMDIIINESTRLSDSIEEFLEYTKLTPTKKEYFNLSKLVNEVLSLINKNSKTIKFIKKYNENIILFADEKKIKQVVWNLITNSIKAINKKGVIEITILDERAVSLYIKDNGVGIGKDEQKKIFTPFYSKFTSGIGLGMSIVKRIIDNHNAKIEVISEPNYGTEIRIVFGEDNERKHRDKYINS